MMNKIDAEREIKTITFNIFEKGLGVYLIGGDKRRDQDENQPYFQDDKLKKENNNNKDYYTNDNVQNERHGVFIKSILPGGLAYDDGRLMPGDQIVSVNGVDFRNIDKERAIELIERSSSEGRLRMEICRDNQAKRDYQDLCTVYGLSESDTPLSFYDNHFVTQDSNFPSSSFNSPPLPSLSNKSPHLEGDLNYQNSTMDPNIRVQIEKLKESLKFLGISPSKEQELELRSRLDIDDKDTVSYGDFVKQSKELFFKSSSPFSSSFQFPPPTNYGTLIQKNEAVEQLNREKSQLLTLLSHKDKVIKATERQLDIHKNKEQDLSNQLNNLISRLSLATEAQKRARRIEQDYELVLRHFEENKNNQNNRIGNQSNIFKAQLERMRLEMLKVNTDLECQQAINQKLLSFNQFVVTSLKKRQQILDNNNSNNKYSLDFRSQDQNLLHEAQHTLEAVSQLIEFQNNNNYKPTSFNNFQEKNYNNEEENRKFSPILKNRASLLSLPNYSNHDDDFYTNYKNKYSRYKSNNDVNRF